MIGSNGYYHTSNFREAIYLRSAGVIFVRTDYLPSGQCEFYFKQPDDKILSAWAQGNDNGVRVILDAADFFRDEIKRAGR